MPVTAALIRGTRSKAAWKIKMASGQQRLRAGIVGATGMVGQRFAILLADHPDFTVTMLAASANSAGKTYENAVSGRWAMTVPIPSNIASLPVTDAADVAGNAAKCDFIFCAVDMPKPDTLALEEAYAKAETPVVSNNSAARMLPDVPMILPEVNPEHVNVIDAQRKRLGTTNGFIAVKPNCSIQSYVPCLSPLRQFGIKSVNVVTFQAISGAGKTFETWPEIVDNVVPFISGEEQKSEQEPMKIWGTVADDKSTIVNAVTPQISAQCLRVACTDGHLAAVSVSFDNKPTKEEILTAWKEATGKPQQLKLHSAPPTLVTYFEEDNRPQTKLDRDLHNGMGVSAGRLREDTIFDYKFVALSHNTLRGAAGGAVLSAELLKADGWIKPK